jgi:hypothetical protein
MTEALQTNGSSGVPDRVPAQPRPTRTLLPASWLRRSVEVSLLDGDSFRGELLDWCGAGPVLATRLSASETTRRVCSWDAIKFVDLRE